MYRGTLSLAANIATMPSMTCPLKNLKIGWIGVMRILAIGPG
tara:strand:+ start:918 stop:1043 length:126 start_codon:yes stop_codon:yes gene_type:complete